MSGSGFGLRGKVLPSTPESLGSISITSDVWFRDKLVRAVDYLDGSFLHTYDPVLNITEDSGCEMYLRHNFQPAFKITILFSIFCVSSKVMAL